MRELKFIMYVIYGAKSTGKHRKAKETCILQAFLVYLSFTDDNSVFAICLPW
ncbi:MAG: hypothetical protein BROFUL_01129 [Candidatus Brocadia fulgida]|jgi:hypothetical protein|uniref:Uncharacterized protein n=1 Tax=Candidatus Brocadia fulgida TaxID=380242 RepID=A0A0M2UX89_9BACT|nr:MAG: hypothetical protein BROFUL_01129 [Candidatus Brocadia fulgida]MBV6519303.1 hypothetical protein [Candidatus Brocadia fulgida]